LKTTVATTVQNYTKAAVETRIAAFSKFFGATTKEVQAQVFGIPLDKKDETLDNYPFDKWQRRVTKLALSQLYILFGFRELHYDIPSKQLWVRAANQISLETAAILKEYQRHQQEVAARGIMTAEEMMEAEQRGPDRPGA
jgi:hypothetical protein